MEKEFAKMLNEYIDKDDLLFFDAIDEFKVILKCNLENLQQELTQYNLKLVTNETANEDEKDYFLPNIVRNSYLVKTV